MAAFRLARVCGWIAVLGSAGVVIGATAWTAVWGWGGLGDAWPTGLLWRSFVNTLIVSGGATILSMVLAMPAAVALAGYAGGWRRGVLVGVVLVPLLTMPSIHGYAWFLLSEALGLLHKARLPGAALAHGLWLWPLPALVMAAAFRHQGVGAMRLALLDASAPRAFFFAALPTMRGPLAAACAGVFMLSAIDSTIPPLVLAPELWSVEWVARAEVAKALPNPLGQMLPPQWPMLTLVALAALAALPGLREMARWADEPEVDGDCVAGDGWLRAACSLAAAALAFLPLAVFAFGLGDGRYDVGESFGRAFAALRGAMGSTLVVAGCAAMGAFCIALAAVEDRSGPALARLPGRVIAGLLIVTAVLPPPVVATAVITVFADPWVSPRAQWNLYDDTPAPWIAGMIARFAFLPVCLVRLMNRRVPRALADLAAVDAGSRLEAVRHGRLPMLWRPALAGAAAVGVLTLSEIVASNLLRPPQWGGGSLGHLVDSYLHFGRHSQTIAMSMMMMIPAIGTAILLAGFERISVRARSGRSA